MKRENVPVSKGIKFDRDPVTFLHLFFFMFFILNFPSMFVILSPRRNVTFEWHLSDIRSTRYWCFYPWEMREGEYVILWKSRDHVFRETNTKVFRGLYIPGKWRGRCNFYTDGKLIYTKMLRSDSWFNESNMMVLHQTRFGLNKTRKKWIKWGN